MLEKIFIVGLAGFLVFPCRPAFAGGTADLEKKLDALTARVAQLEAQLERQKTANTALPNRVKQEMGKMQNEMDQFFQGNAGGKDLTRSLTTSFDQNISETKEQYIYKMHLPGADKDKIKVEVKDRLLKVSGEADAREQLSEAGKVVNTNSKSTFSKFQPLPDDADETKVASDYSNGVLTVTVDRKDEGK